MRYYHSHKPNYLGALAVTALILAGGFFGYDYLSTSRLSAADPAVVPENPETPAPLLNTEQIALLSKIENLKLDGAVLSTDAFKSLEDWERDLGTQEAGKPNPFAPISGLQTGPSTR